jgi:Ca2+-binding EF-hand superfamily protein
MNAAIWKRLAVAALAGAVAQPVLAADEAPDVIKGAVNPYEPGSERTRFLAAAGVDSEMSEDEFKSNATASDAFVRKYDSWSTLKAFDRNANGTIDWFEADAYRRALRSSVLAAYDKDKDGQLNEAEHLAANTDLAAGKVPAVSRPSAQRTGPGFPGGDQPRTEGNQSRRRGNDGGDRGGDRAAREAEFLKKYDKDGDGRLSDEERSAGRRAEFEAWKERNPEEAARFEERRAEFEKRRAEFLQKYDKDGNGELSDEERNAGFAAEREEWRKNNPEAAARFDKAREDFLKKNDKDGDGQLSDEERRAGFAALREEGRKRWEELSKKHDKDGDGQLNREEREAAFRELRESGGGFPFFGGPGGPGGGRDGGRGRGNN